MTQTIVITGGSRESRGEKALEIAAELMETETPEKSADFVLLSPEEGEKSIKIAQTRELKDTLKLTPFGPMRVVFIPQAELLTKEAQNSLLKTLEEPPEHTSLILGVRTKNSLLPTIVSRCLEINLSEIKEAKDDLEKEEIVRLLKMKRGERLSWVQDNEKLIKDEVALTELLQDWTETVGAIVSPLGERATGASRARSYLSSEDWLKITGELRSAVHTVSTTVADRKLTIEVMLLNFPEVEG